MSDPVMGVGLEWDADRQALVLTGRSDAAVLAWGPGWKAHAAPAVHGGVDVAGGLVLHWSAPGPCSQAVVPLGPLQGVQRAVCLHRFSPFWVRPRVGTDVRELPPETLWWMGECAPDLHLMLVPLIDGAARFALQGSELGLAVAMQTGDEAVQVEGGRALIAMWAPDPHALAQQAARTLRALSPEQVGPLREEKPDPDFLDLLGWCTWDAFYKDVTVQGVQAGLTAFAKAGVQPRLLILDDGWHQRRSGPDGEDALAGQSTHAGFGGALRSVCQAAKEVHGVERVLVWHALLGYWGGLDAQTFVGHGVRRVERRFGPGILAHGPGWNEGPWGRAIQVPDLQRLAAFYDEWHAELAAQGVDGVKVDAQGLLEAVSRGQGGQVHAAYSAKAALEASVMRHFEGRVIHCMACNQEGAYLNRQTAVLRTSDDFFPDQPASHGMHLWVNALAGLWFGQFMRPDWDMFQSQHAMGRFHAAARAISGGPVVLSDKPGQHDAAVLQQLALSNGRVPRAHGVAQPCPDSLYSDPLAQGLPLKIFNRCGHAAVVGVFHLGGSPSQQTARVTLADVPGLISSTQLGSSGGQRVGSAHDEGSGESRSDSVPRLQWRGWHHRGQRLWRAEAQDAPPIELQPFDWELVTLVPVLRGVAVFGLEGLLNMAGTIDRSGFGLNERSFTEEAAEADAGAARDDRTPATLCTADTVFIRVLDGGSLLAWVEVPPRSVHDGQAPLPFTVGEEGLLRVQVRNACTVELRW